MQIKCNTHSDLLQFEVSRWVSWCVKCESVGWDSLSASVLTKDALAANGSVLSRQGLTVIGVCVSSSAFDGVCVWVCKCCSGDLADGVFVGFVELRLWGTKVGFSKWACWLNVECISETTSSFSKESPSSSSEVVTLGKVNVSFVSVGGACDSECFCVLSMSVMCVSVSVSVVCGVCSPLHAPCSWHRQRKRETSKCEFFVGIYFLFRLERSMIVFTQEESEGEIRRTCTGAYKSQCVYMAQKDKILNINNKTYTTVLLIFLSRKILLLENVSCKQQLFMKKQ